VYTKLMVFIAYRTCTASLYTSTYSQLIPEFHSSRLVCTLGLSMFVAGLGTGPMVLSPLSEVCSPPLAPDKDTHGQSRCPWRNKCLPDASFTGGVPSIFAPLPSFSSL
jgi:hypothetical protein